MSYKDKNKNGSIETGVKTIWQDDFESASGWDGSGASWGWSISGFDANFSRTGEYSGYLEPSANPGERVSHSNEWVEMDHSKGSEVIFSGWVYVENDSWNHAEFFLMMKAPGETGYATEWVNTNSAYTKEKWVYLSKKVTVPSHISHINFRIDNDGPGKVWYDDLSIAQVNPDDVIEIVEENNYYPFGLQHKGYNNTVVSEHPYGFKGKEENDELGLEWLDFGARNYDASLGRWMNVDPLADDPEQVDKSPYAFTWNNPINLVDPTGMKPDDWVERTDNEGNKSIVWDENVTSADDKDLQSDDRYLGKAVVVFEGSENEKLGKGDNLFGEGANLAKATVYGPDGADDIKEYGAYTMSSDPSKYRWRV